MDKRLTIIVKIFVPIVILAVAFFGARALAKSKSEPEKKAPAPRETVVNVITAHSGDYRFTVRSQGTVEPRAETAIVAQVPGEVVWVSPSMVEGGFFAKGDVLLKIEKEDYEIAVSLAKEQMTQAEKQLVTAESGISDAESRVAQAKAGMAQAASVVSQAKLALMRVEEQAAVAKAEWDASGSEDPSPLALFEPQLTSARAALASAEEGVLSAGEGMKAAVAGRGAADTRVEQAVSALDSARLGKRKAELALERTEIAAPFDGRVKFESIGVGQYVAPGAPVATVYAVDYAEIRLPLGDAELAFLDLPEDFLSSGVPAEGVKVTLSADFAGAMRTWRGTLSRTDGRIDPRSRMVSVIVTVYDPYGKKSGNGEVPLAAGMFVEASIEGRLVEGVFVLPRGAVREDGRVVVVNGERRLELRNVEVLRFEAESAVIGGGISNGELVSVSFMEIVTEGMKVKVKEPAE